MTPAIIREDVIYDYSCAAPFFREAGAIVDMCMMVFGLTTLFFTRLSRHSDSTPGGRRVPLRAHDCRAFRTVQAALQIATS